jgi:predicted kinase
MIQYNAEAVELHINSSQTSVEVFAVELVIQFLSKYLPMCPWKNQINSNDIDIVKNICVDNKTALLQLHNKSYVIAELAMIKIRYFYNIAIPIVIDGKYITGELSNIATLDGTILKVLRTNDYKIIPAIRYCREQTSMGLKEAKDYVEALMKKHNIG